MSAIDTRLLIPPNHEQLEKLYAEAKKTEGVTCQELSVTYVIEEEREWVGKMTEDEQLAYALKLSKSDVGDQDLDFNIIHIDSDDKDEVFKQKGLQPMRQVGNFLDAERDYIREPKGEEETKMDITETEAEASKESTLNPHSHYFSDDEKGVEITEESNPDTMLNRPCGSGNHGKDESLALHIEESNGADSSGTEVEVVFDEANNTENGTCTDSTPTRDTEELKGELKKVPELEGRQGNGKKERKPTFNPQVEIDQLLSLSTPKCKEEDESILR
jgi:hypothetical protein